MHELSIAQAMQAEVNTHALDRHTVSAVHVIIGPLQQVNQQALNFAWQAVTAGTRLEGAALRITQLPYRWACPDCGARWDSGDDVFVICSCGCERPKWVGGDELLIDSLEVEEAESERAVS